MAMSHLFVARWQTDRCAASNLQSFPVQTPSAGETADAACSV